MIADLIPKVAQMGAEAEHEYRPRPSSAGPEKCIRQMVYHGLRTEKASLPGRALLVFDDSTWHEELTGDWIRQTAFRLHSEQMTIKCRRPMLEGHIDGIVTDLVGIDRLYEHKAINHFTFQRFWAGEMPWDYFSQCACYLEAIQFHIDPDIKQGILLIKNKNTAQYMEFLIEYDKIMGTLKVIEKTHSTGDHEKINLEIHNIVDDACQKFLQVQDYIDHQTLPKRQYDFDSWRCEYCQYGKKCWDGYEKEFLELKTDTLLPNEFADKVRFYRELGGQKSNIEKQYKEIGSELKNDMKEAGAREGRAGEYVVKMQLQDRTGIDKNLLTDSERERAKTISRSERLYISQPKEKTK